MGRFRGDRLRQVRELRQLTREELTARLGIGATQLYKYEEAGVEPRANVVARLAEELAVTADYLLGLVDEPQAHLSEDDLSPIERKLVDAYRDGRIIEAIEAVIEKGKQ
jgi:Predicted transcriptional regulators